MDWLECHSFAVCSAPQTWSVLQGFAPHVFAPLHQPQTCIAVCDICEPGSIIVIREALDY